jgi:hypothetical protein
MSACSPVGAGREAATARLISPNPAREDARGYDSPRLCSQRRDAPARRRQMHGRRGRHHAGAVRDARPERTSARAIALVVATGVDSPSPR